MVRVLPFLHNEATREFKMQQRGTLYVTFVSIIYNYTAIDGTKLSMTTTQRYSTAARQHRQKKAASPG
jgi:hypothetical protein